MRGNTYSDGGRHQDGRAAASGIDAGGYAPRRIAASHEPTQSRARTTTWRGADSIVYDVKHVLPREMVERGL